MCFNTLRCTVQARLHPSTSPCWHTSCTQHGFSPFPCHSFPPFPCHSMASLPSHETRPTTLLAKWWKSKVSHFLLTHRYIHTSNVSWYQILHYILNTVIVKWNHWQKDHPDEKTTLPVKNTLIPKLSLPISTVHEALSKDHPSLKTTPALIFYSGLKSRVPLYLYQPAAPGGWTGPGHLAAVAHSQRNASLYISK